MSDLYIEPIVGYRAWTVDHNHNLISRMMKEPDEVWPADEKLSAICRVDSPYRQKADPTLPEIHDSPAWGCTCGIYAFHEMEDMLEGYSRGRKTIVGSAVFWGKIVVNTVGFKAQYARPVAFANYRHREQFSDLAWIERAEQVVAKYNVPLLPLDMLEQYTLTFGQRIIDEIEE